MEADPSQHREGFGLDRQRWRERLVWIDEMGYGKFYCKTLARFVAVKRAYLMGF